VFNVGFKLLRGALGKGDIVVSNNQETPEERRERMRQEELERNPSGSVHGGGLADLVGKMSWKGALILIVALLLGFIIYSVFFR